MVIRQILVHLGAKKDAKLVKCFKNSQKYENIVNIKGDNKSYVSSANALKFPVRSEREKKLIKIFELFTTFVKIFSLLCNCAVHNNTNICLPFKRKSMLGISEYNL